MNSPALEEPSMSSPHNPRTRLFIGLSVCLSLLAFATAGWLFARISFLEDQISKSQTAQAEAQETLQAQTETLDKSLRDIADNTVNLRSLTQEAALGRDALMLSEAEYTLTLAGQQLQLTGLPPAALAAVQSLEQRLSQTDRPLLSGVHKALRQDLERLRSPSALDTPALSRRLEEAILSIEHLPFALEARPAAAAPTPRPTTTDNTLDRFLSSLWADLKNLVRVERVDATPILLSAEQQFLVRQILVVRLSSARLALQSRDIAHFKPALLSAHQLLSQHFNVKAPAVQSTLSSLKRLAETPTLLLEPPPFQETLTAIRHAQSMIPRRP